MTSAANTGGPIQCIRFSALRGRELGHMDRVHDCRLRFEHTCRRIYRCSVVGRHPDTGEIHHASEVAIELDAIFGIEGDRAFANPFDIRHQHRLTCLCLVMQLDLDLRPRLRMIVLGRLRRRDRLLCSLLDEILRSSWLVVDDREGELRRLRQTLEADTLELSPQNEDSKATKQGSL